jgi:RNA polymerase-binding transcription factor DksA
MEPSFDVAILDEVESELAGVEHAMQRLEDGTYATCERCGGPIDGPRLETMPLTRLCRDHEA